ncbi:MAG: RluA family pseudouridine synthase [Spirochaetales bacterium]|jgi:23S rRNA pseudouridine1911/1915/1917 synthase|nr:RluA family pseudouridine synthase [Spirochaetales bacterium]
MSHLSLTVGPDVPPGTRIDKFLAGAGGPYTRSQLKTALKEIRQNGIPVKASKQVRPGDCIEIDLREPEAPLYEAEKIDLDILYEDSRVIAVNKPRGMVVHPGSGAGSGTLIQGLLYHAREIADNFPGEKIRPGIVHRLDKDTSGVIIAAKDPLSLEFLAGQFRGRTVKKVYLAIVKGRLPQSRGTISGCIRRDVRHRKRFIHAESGGKAAETRYRVLSECGAYSLVRLAPKTGRTHQLRVHMKALGCPILGDPIYGRRDESFPQAGLMLHAFRLSLTLPGEPQKRTFRAPLPADFALLMKRLFPSADSENAMNRGQD